MIKQLIKMFKFVALAALLACATAIPNQPRSKLPTLDGRIVGGRDAYIEEFPYQVSLLWFGSHICGGSLISQNFVVTAAHCTDGATASQFSIRVGSSIRNSGGSTYTVSQVHQHPQYDEDTIDFDISVLRISNNVALGSAVGLIGLPTQDQPINAGDDATVTGWGTLTEGGILPSQLQAVVVPVVSQAECRRAYGTSSITDRMMCAGVPQGGKDACQGDSGGPLVVGGELIGIVSWGYGCARPGFPGVYSSVPALRSFILSQAGI
ncbi:trypsin delta-like [Onthophagus taurus]|uniref:trypsin delta-like n=1 Tax=Onthophagus taurus TaxID=166361 RepID=UPI0039BEAECD